MDERELWALEESIAKIAAGDPCGIDEIYDAIGGKMLSVAFAVLKDRMLAEDAVQDSFLKLAKYAKRFKSSNGPAWILTIVKNTALNRYKYERRRRGADPDSCAEPSDGGTGAALSENAVLCRQALSCLSETERRVIELKYFGDLTVREIAVRLGIPKSTVQRTAERAESQMRRFLGADTC